MLRCEGYCLAIDGILGNDTEWNVKYFRNDVGIGVDGKAGPVTFGELFG
ncbi:peptidoglycan-binding protein [Paraliobacillus sp. JSM ZJ581]